MSSVRDVSPDAASLVLQVDLPADVADVMAAWTDAQRLTAWWPPVATFAARPGGVYAFAWPEQGWRLRGRVAELSDAHLAFSWRWDHRPELPDRQVRISVAPGASPGSSVLTLQHGPYEATGVDTDDRAEHEAGWRYFLGRLAAALDGAAAGE